jgi:protein O-mannosyl-transferase
VQRIWARWLPAAAVALLLVVFGLYADTTGGPFVWDDYYQIAENPAVTRGVPLSAYFLDPGTTTNRADYNSRIYRPLRNVAFRAIAVTAGVSPAAYHLSSLTVYAACTLLVLLLGWRLWRSVPIAFLTALVWAVLPVHVEAVCYPSALGDLLSLALMLGAFLAALAVIEGTARPLALSLAAAVLALLAMLTKEMAITTSLVVGAYVLLSGRRSREITRLLALVGAVTVAYLALRTSVVGTMGQEPVTPAAMARGLREAPVLLLAYGKIVLAPLGHQLAYLVSFPGAPGLALVLLALVGLAAGAWVLDRRQPAPSGFRMGLAWFAIVLVPVLHLVPLWADLADRFALVPSVAVALVLGRVLTWPAPGRRRQLVCAAVAAPLVLIYAAGSRIEQRYWRSERALWLHAIAEQPDSGMAWSNLGAAYLNEGDFQPAARAYERGRALGSTDPRSLFRGAIALDGAGRPAEALSLVEQALARDPGDTDGQALRGDLLRRRGDLDGARAALDQARRLAPLHPSVDLLAAALADGEGRRAEAARIYQGLADRVPRIARFRYLAARAALTAGDAATAGRQAEACLRLEPGQPQCVALLESARR